MIRGAGQDGGLARAAIEAALKAQDKAAQRIESKVDAAFQAVEAQALQQPGGAGAVPGAVEAPAGSSPADSLHSTIGKLDQAFSEVDRLPLELVDGGINDFSQLASRLKQSELTFKFALEVRNKLIDAYRETMRMSV